jgi:hypothetical protein
VENNTCLLYLLLQQLETQHAGRQSDYSPKPGPTQSVSRPLTWKMACASVRTALLAPTRAVLAASITELKSHDPEGFCTCAAVKHATGQHQQWSKQNKTAEHFY